MHPFEILEFPDPRLRTIASPVKNITDEIVKFSERLLFTMYDAAGIGLAASQVNFHQRIIAIDISETKNEPLILINPVIIETAGEIESNEGCLSVPGFYEPIKRFSEIKLEAVSANGKSFSLEATELLAICIQHEIDHLDGKLFVDYVSKTKKQLIRKKLSKKKASRLGSK